MKINEKLFVRVCGQNGPITPIQTGAYETWHNGWECLGLHSELQGKKLILQVKVSEKVLGRSLGDIFAGAIIFTRDWPASRGGPDTWVKPGNFKAADTGFVFFTEVLWDADQTDAATNNLSVVEVTERVFKTHEFCVRSDGEYVFLVYNITYHGQMFKRGNELFVPDLQRKNVVSPNILRALQKRVDPATVSEYDINYKCWAEMIDYSQLGDDEAIVYAMATPIGSFYVRDKKCQHTTATWRNIDVSPGPCPFPTVGLVCRGVFKNADERPVLNNIEFYSDSEERYGAMMTGDSGVVIPDMGVPEARLIARGRRWASKRKVRREPMVLPPLDEGILELGRLAFEGK